MSDRRKQHDRATTASQWFSDLWKRVSKRSQNRLRSNRSGKLNRPKQTPSSVVGTTSYTRCKDVKTTPQRRVKTTYTCLNNGDSQSDGDVLQDIIWDPTSPTPANNGKEPRHTRVVEISDIVNRIAPKDAKPVSVDSPLLQWIRDSFQPCTPEPRQPRVRKKSLRQSKIEDLMKLARQFDINMHQQDKESAEEQRNNTINNLSKQRNPTGPASCGDRTATLTCVEEVKGPPSRSQQVEEELHALFNRPTQQLSQGSSTSACSQDVTGHTRISHPAAANSKVSEVAAREGTSCLPTPSGEAEGQSNGVPAKGDDFDDDWEDDDLLNDLFMEEMSQNYTHQEFPNVMPVSSKAAAAILGSSKDTSDQTSKGVGVASGSLKDVSEEAKSLYDFETFDGDDDKLLYQVCDNVERISNNSHHASFKRHLSDSDATNNKVFVTGQMTGKCSAAEIERKRQEAIARRRSRTQASLKPGARGGHRRSIIDR